MTCQKAENSVALVLSIGFCFNIGNTKYSYVCVCRMTWFSARGVDSEGQR